MTPFLRVSHLLVVCLLPNSINLILFLVLPERKPVSDSGRVLGVLGSNLRVLCYQSYPRLMYPTLKNDMFIQNFSDRTMERGLL